MVSIIGVIKPYTLEQQRYDMLYIIRAMSYLCCSMVVKFADIKHVVDGFFEPRDMVLFMKPW